MKKWGFRILLVLSLPLLVGLGLPAIVVALLVLVYKRRREDSLLLAGLQRMAPSLRPQPQTEAEDSESARTLPRVPPPEEAPQEEKEDHHESRPK
jgi:hypothetical protein